MTALDKNLLPGEEILYRTKKHWIIFFAPFVVTIALLFFLTNVNPYVTKISFVPAIAAGLLWINQFLLYITSEFAVTNKRIMMREGFFIRHTNDTRITTIANVSVYQGILGQLLNYGTVIIHAFGGENDPFTLIASPNDFQRALQAQLDLATR